MSHFVFLLWYWFGIRCLRISTSWSHSWCSWVFKSIVMTRAMIIIGSVNILYWKCQLLRRYWLNTCVIVCMASKQKKDFIVWDKYRLWKCAKQTHTVLDLDTVSTVHLFFFFLGHGNVPHLTISIVDFIFLYVSVYSLLPLWMVTLLHLTPKQ